MGAPPALLSTPLPRMAHEFHPFVVLNLLVTLMLTSGQPKNGPGQRLGQGLNSLGSDIGSKLPGQLQEGLNSLGSDIGSKLPGQLQQGLNSLGSGIGSWRPKPMGEMLNIREKRGEDSEALSRCKIEGRSDCKALFQSLMGRNMSIPSNPLQAEVMERTLGMKGLTTVMGSSMKDCMNTTGNHRDCMSRVKEQFMNATNRTGLDPKAMDALVGRQLQKAGMEKAAGEMRACFDRAADQAEKQDCFKSEAAKRAAAMASGRDVSDITDWDLKKAARADAKKAVNSGITSCMEDADSPEEKRACLMGMRGLAAGSMGMEEGDLKDDRLRELIDERAADNVLAALKACDKSTAEKKSACMSEARRVRAMGMGKENATDFDLRSAAKAALGRELSGLMETCMADNDTSVQDCRQAAMATMKDADFDGTVPHPGELEKALRNAAVSTAAAVMEDCGEGGCLAMMKDQVAQARGMRKENMSKLEFSRIVKDARNMMTKNLAKSCHSARLDNATAACEDFYALHLRAMNRSRPTDAKTARVEELRVKKGAIRSAAESTMEACFGMASREDFKACMGEARGETEAVMESMLGSMGPAKKERTRKHAEQEATVNILGKMFEACIQAATGNQTEVDACLETMKQGTAKADVGENATDVLRKYRAKVLMGPASCSSGDMRTCREEAKQRAIDMGMKPREYRTVAKMGEIKAAGEKWAECKESGEEDDECDAMAQVELEKVTGAENTTLDDQMKARIRNIARAIMDGTKLVVVRRKRLDITVTTSGAACNSSVEDEVAEQAANETKSVEPTASDIGIKKPCRLVDQKPEYGAYVGVDVPDERLEAAADTVAGNLQGRDLGSRRLQETARRLATVQDAYAAQDTAECGESDAACAADTVPLTDTPTSTATTTTTATTSPTVTIGITGEAGPKARGMMSIQAAAMLVAVAAWL